MTRIGRPPLLVLLPPGAPEATSVVRGTERVGGGAGAGIARECLRRRDPPAARNWTKRCPPATAPGTTPRRKARPAERAVVDRTVGGR